MQKQDDVGTSLDIMQVRLESAAEKLAEAIDLHKKAQSKGRSFNGSISRSYYAIFKTISAIHALDGNAYKRHKDAIAQFNKNYVITKIFPKDVGRKIHQAFTRRNNSDYNDFYRATKDESAEQIKFAKNFLDKAKAYCYAKSSCKLNTDTQYHFR